MVACFSGPGKAAGLIRQGEPTLLVHPYRPGWGWLLPAHSRGGES